MFRKFLAGALLLALTGLAGAGEGVRIYHAWIRLLPADLPAAGYFVLENQTDHTVTLTGVSASAFGGAMLHQSAEGTMRHVHSIKVPAGEQLRVAPGGYHIMFMPPHEPLQPGDRVPVTLEFADGSTRSADFLVKGPAAVGWSESK
ncbi:MAG: copper chaperone PCu(A)C [Nitrococcus sp.]|nr:copper chaperone PCu(A)C [Nitrococcus sp.]